MMNFEIMSKLIEERFLENKIDVFRVDKIGELLKTGILFYDINEFFRLLATANINRVFVYEHFEFPEDYYITEEAVGIFPAGTSITINDYLGLSEAEKEKCHSMIITLAFS